MYQWFVNLGSPYSVLMLALGVSVVALWRGSVMSRRQRWGVASSYLALYFISLPSVSFLLIGGLEWKHPVPREWDRSAQAIVVLSGGYLAAGAGRPFPEPSPSTFLRCVYAAELYRAQQRPVVVTGGPPSGTTLESDARQMGQLLQSLGVAERDLILEEESQTTFENAANTSRILRDRGYRKVILVTDASHLRRAVQCFEKQGVTVQAAGCSPRASQWPPLGLGWFVPSLSALVDSHQAWHEWIGLVWYWAKGRI